MSTLLESRTHHHRVRALSRKLQESNTHVDEPTRRRIPAHSTLSPPTANNNSELTRRQRGQRERRQKEKNIRKTLHSDEIDEELPSRQVLVAPSNIHSTRRQRGQRRRWLVQSMTVRVSVLFIAPSLPTY